MHIIHLLLGKGNPDRMNGVNKIVHNLVMGQQRKGHLVELWGITPDPESETIPRNYTTHFFQRQKLPFALDTRFKKQLDRLPSGTVFHLHGAFIPAFFSVARFLVRRRIAYVFTPHGPYNEQAMKKNKQIKKVYFSYFESYLLRHAKTVQLSGLSEEQSLKRMLDLSGKQCIVPNGQNMEDISFDFSPLQKKGPVFGFCGRLAIDHKGLDLMLKAFYNYINQGGKGMLWLVGDGVDREALEQVVSEYGLEEKVRFYGARFGQEKLNLIANMDIFLHTSRFEGMPTAVVEAAALGKPCLVTERTNVEDYIDDFNAGISVRPNSVDGITSAMKRMEEHYQKGTLQILSDNARQMTRSVFNWDAIADRLLELYAA